MIHHGATLKRNIERLGFTQQVAAEKLGYATHQAFAALYRKEVFNEIQIAKITAAFDLSRELFFPKPSETDSWASFEKSAVNDLVKAQAKIIELQQIIIENGLAPALSRPHHMKAS